MELEKLLAAVGLVVCAALLAGMLLGARRLVRWRAAGLRLLHWRRHRADARREAEAAIDRVRRRVERDGNVYKPKSFERGKRGPDEPLH